MTAARSLLFGWVRRPPTDLLAVVGLVLLADIAVFNPIASESPIRIITGLLFVLFVPGYALVAVLFPAAGPTGGTSDHKRESNDTSPQPGWGVTDGFRSIDRWDRLGLSVALSLATVPLLALALTLSSASFSMLSFTTLSLFMTISVFTVLCALIAMKRRFALPPHRRFRFAFVQWLTNVRRSLTETNSRSAAALNVALVAAILLAVGTFGFAVASPPDGELYTEFYLVSEDDGEFVVADYPDSVTPGEPLPVYPGVENYEGETTEYEIVVQLQRVDDTEQGTSVIERNEVDQFSVNLDSGERRIIEQNLTVSDELTGSDLRLEFLLYKDSPPESPTRENAYRDLHIWIDVPSDDQTSSTITG